MASGRLRARLAGRSFVTGRRRFSPDSRLVMAIEGGGGIPTTRSPSQPIPPSSSGTPTPATASFATSFTGGPGATSKPDFLQGGTVLGAQWLESDEKVTVSSGTSPSTRRTLGSSSSSGGVDKAQFSPADTPLRDDGTGSDPDPSRGPNGIISQELPVTVGRESQWDVSPGWPSRHGVGTRAGHDDLGLEAGKPRWRTTRVGSWPRLSSSSADGQTMVADEAARTGFVQIWDRRTGRWSRLRPDPTGKARTYQGQALGRWKTASRGRRSGRRGRCPGHALGRAGPTVTRNLPGSPRNLYAPPSRPTAISLFLACSIEVCRWLLGPPNNRTPLDLTGHTDEGLGCGLLTPTERYSPRGVMTRTSRNESSSGIGPRADSSGWSGHPGTIAQLAFSPDGRSLASVALCKNDNAAIWDPTTGQLRTPLVGHTRAVRTVAYSPDGSLLATAGSDSAIRHRDPTTGRLKRLLSGHSQSVHQVVFAADGRTLASAGDDQTTRLWDLATGEARNVLVGPHDNLPLHSHRTDRFLATTGESGQIKLWVPPRASQPREDPLRRR